MDGRSSDNYNKRHYLSVWKGLLEVFLVWPESRVAQWVQDTGMVAFLDDPHDMVYHETPQYWVKHLFVPDSLKARLSDDEVYRVEGRILDAFKDEHHYHFPKDTDWEPYRAKVERILSEYGERLPVLASR